jgi:Asp-tRNA(Asn)/Glu-tRNA(Gln) amidotransferase A subunit family amidase
MSSIYGKDGHDLSVRDAAFNWKADLDWKQLKIGYFKEEFEPPKQSAPDSEKAPATETEEERKRRERMQTEIAGNRARREYDRRYDLAALDRLHAMGVTLTAVELPKLPYDAMTALLTAEAAASFDDLTMSGRDKLLTEQGPYDWPNDFRVSRFYPAVEYIQANRARTLAIAAWTKLFAEVDVIVTPTAGEQLVATNLTGNPAVILPNGLRGSDAPVPPEVDSGFDDAIGGPGTPVSLTFLGGIYQDAKLCAFARAYQQAAGFEHLHPRL